MVTRPRNLPQADPYFDSVVFLAPLSADDPYAGNVTLNVPFDGADAATLADDFSYKEHTLTFNANAQLDTAQSKFGTASCLFDGVGDYVSIPDDTSLSP